MADPNARVMWAQLARLDVTTVAARAKQQRAMRVRRVPVQGAIVAFRRSLGVDLAWGEGSELNRRIAAVSLRSNPVGGSSLLRERSDLTRRPPGSRPNAVTDTLLFVDAPLIVDNLDGRG